MAVTFANACANSTPGAISSVTPVARISSDPFTSPRQKRSASVTTSPMRPPSRRSLHVVLAGAVGGAACAAQPAEGLRHVRVGADVELDPTARGEAAMRAHAVLAEGTRLVGARQPDPQIAVLVAQRKTGEQPGADEIAPAAEHRRDPHAGPLTKRAIEARGGSGAATLQHAARLASLAEAAKPAPPRHGEPFCH